MKNSQITSALITGAAAGMVVGAASYMVAGHSKKKGMALFKKSAGRALRAVGGALENASYMMK